MDSDNITIKDKKGRVRLFIGLTGDDFPVMKFYDSSGKNRISIGFRADDSPHAYFYDNNENPGVVIQVYTVNDIEVSTILLNDHERKDRIRLSLEHYPKMTRGAMGLYNQHGSAMAALGFTERKDNISCGGAIMATDKGPGVMFNMFNTNNMNSVVQVCGSIVIDNQWGNVSFYSDPKNSD